MILVDTNIWVNHLRRADSTLNELLNAGKVACHPFIIGEMACGNLRNRFELIALFKALPSVSVVDPDEVLEFVEARKLMGKGLGYIDMHLLASTIVSGHLLWSNDKRLARAAKNLKVSYLQ